MNKREKIKDHFRRNKERYFWVGGIIIAIGGTAIGTVLIMKKTENSMGSDSESTPIDGCTRPSGGLMGVPVLPQALIMKRGDSSGESSLAIEDGGESSLAIDPKVSINSSVFGD